MNMWRNSQLSRRGGLVGIGIPRVCRLAKQASCADEKILNLGGNYIFLRPL